MPRFNPANLERARELISHYPRAKSATIPMCHLAQEQDGYLTEEAMAHIAELVGCTNAEIYGTASFYEMFKFHPVGTYIVGVCTNITCLTETTNNCHAHNCIHLRVYTRVYPRICTRIPVACTCRLCCRQTCQ